MKWNKKVIKVISCSLLFAFLPLFLGIIFLPSLAYAISQAAVLFLLIEPGARATGMGNSFTGIANDATAMYYNPAGLTQMKIGSAELSSVQWLKSFTNDLFHRYVAASYSYPAIGTFGVSLTYLQLGEYASMDEQGKIEKFKAYEYALSLGYAKKVDKNLSVGLAGKYIKSNLAAPGSDFGTATAWAVDIGILYNNFAPDLCYKKKFLAGDFSQIFKWTRHRMPPGPSIGLSILNMGPKISYGDRHQADPLPQNLRLGLAWNFFDTDLLGIIGSVDFRKLLVRPHGDKPADEYYKAIFTSWQEEDVFNNVIISAGLEISLFSLSSLRLGRYIDNEGKVKYWTIGLDFGAETARLNLSYYMTDDDWCPLDETIIFSLSVAY